MLTEGLLQNDFAAVQYRSEQSPTTTTTSSSPPVAVKWVAVLLMAASLAAGLAGASCILLPRGGLCPRTLLENWVLVAAGVVSASVAARVIWPFSYRPNHATASDASGAIDALGIEVPVIGSFRGGSDSLYDAEEPLMMHPFST